MGWDGAGNYFFDTTASTYVGGAHYIDYTSPYFTFTADAWTYAVWWDVLYNELEVQWNNYRVCDSLWSIVEVGKVYVDFEVGVYTCNSTVYDYFIAGDPVSHTCELTYYSFDNLLNYNHQTWQWALWPNTCNYDSPAWVYIQDPTGPSEDVRDAEVEAPAATTDAESETTTTDEEGAAALRI